MTAMLSRMWPWSLWSSLSADVKDGAQEDSASVAKEKGFESAVVSSIAPRADATSAGGDKNSNAVQLHEQNDESANDWIDDGDAVAVFTGSCHLGRFRWTANVRVADNMMVEIKRRGRRKELEIEAWQVASKRSIEFKAANGQVLRVDFVTPATVDRFKSLISQLL